jgi:hypothetical protein
MTVQCVSDNLGLDTIHFVVGADGKPDAVQVNIETWRRIVDALEDAEDVALAREALAELDAAGGDPDKAGWLRSEDLGRVAEVK